MIGIQMSNRPTATEDEHTGELNIYFRIRDSHRFFIYMGVILYAIVLIRNLWISDDAFITMRVIDNLLNNYGLTWNVGERLQVFTNPLWLFLLTVLHSIISDPYPTLYLGSFICSLAAVGLMLWELSPGYKYTIVALVPLVTSKSFVDYSSSGLENPLSHLLIILYVIVLIKVEGDQLRRLGLLSLLTSLGMLNRLDLALVFVPALLYEIYQAREYRWRTLIPVMAGFLPLIAWEVFATLYYGFPLPNTYFAKVQTGINPYLLAEQGQRYLENSLNWDPITALTVGAAALMILVERDRRKMLLMGGGVMYILYVISIGGDFMSGRFFSPILVLSLALLLRSPLSEIMHFDDRRAYLTLLSGVLIIGISVNHPPLLTKADWLDQTANLYGGVADEKLYYFNSMGWLNYHRSRAPHQWGVEGQNAKQAGEGPVVRENIGSFGYYAGPEIYVVDRHALADPLRARLPAVGLERVGHYRRVIPKGYLETIEAGFDNRINQPDLHRYYDMLLIIIRGDIFDSQRLQTIWDMNRGVYDHLIDEFIASGEWEQ